MNASKSFLDRERRPFRWAVSWLAVALFCLPSWAGGGGGNSNNGGSPDNQFNASGGGDEVTSLPMLESTGLTFVGELREIRALVLSIQGSYRIQVSRLPRGGMIVTLEGDFLLELDRAALARTGVYTLFKGGTPFTGGVAVLRVDTSTMRLPAERVQLPLSRLATSTLQGRVLGLDAYGLRGQHTGIAANYGTDRVTLVQRIL